MDRGEAKSYIESIDMKIQVAKDIGCDFERGYQLGMARQTVIRLKFDEVTTEHSDLYEQVDARQREIDRLEEKYRNS